MKNRIIVPTDLTKAAESAINQAVDIAKKSGSSLTLFHVMKETGPEAQAVLLKLNIAAEMVRQTAGIVCEVEIKAGDILDMIAFIVSERNYDLMVIGTHGFQGIRQKIFGADILKLVERIPIPVLVVQEESPMVQAGLKLLVPVSSHDNFSEMLESLLLFITIYNMEVHLYSIHKPGFEWPPQMLANIDFGEKWCNEKGVRMVRVKEEQKGFSTGYARQTIQYAHTAGTDAIWMISAESRDYYSFAKDYKETILLNEFHLPVLCVGGGAES